MIVVISVDGRRDIPAQPPPMGGVYQVCQDVYVVYVTRLDLQSVRASMHQSDVDGVVESQ